MSYLHCPYCEIKEEAKLKVIFETIKPIEGECPDCGAWLDKGQVKVSVNGYADIYKGALRLIDNVVKQFNHILDYCDVDLSDYFDEEGASVSIYTSDIIDNLFLPYYGGTTKSNFKNALGISEHEHCWKIGEDVEE